MIIKRILKKLIPVSIVIKLKKILYHKNNKLMINKLKKTHQFNIVTYPRGVNLIGDIKAETGIGQSMRILADLLCKGKISFCVVQVDAPGDLKRNDNTWNHMIKEKPVYSINLINIIPGTWAEDYLNIDNKFFDYRYNIAFWPWELENFPKCWLPCIDTVDEIWTPSEFSSNSIRKQTNKPVITVPHIIIASKKNMYDREYFGLPREKFLYLTMYDFKSISERKNPQAVLQAFKKAFPRENDNVGMVIKVNHDERHKEVDKLKQELKEYKNIYYITNNLNREEVDALIEATDVFVSLHRSEGFGLPLAEAMSLGKPVISTNWSATTEFMCKNSACLVEYELVKIKKNIGPYEKGNYWADASTVNAADYMKKLYTDNEYYNYIAKNAKSSLAHKLSYDKVVGIIHKRINVIHKSDK